MNKTNWVIQLSDSFYHQENCGSNTEDFNKAYIFKDKTRDEMQKIGDSFYKGIRGRWKIETYENALDDYEKRIYIDPVTKELRWSEWINISEAIRLSRQGQIVGYKCKDETKVFFKEDFPTEFSTEIILNANWRLIKQCQ